MIKLPHVVQYCPSSWWLTKASHSPQEDMGGVRLREVGTSDHQEWDRLTRLDPDRNSGGHGRRVQQGSGWAWWTIVHKTLLVVLRILLPILLSFTFI